jgi:hypothetical protein
VIESRRWIATHPGKTTRSLIGGMAFARLIR